MVFNNNPIFQDGRWLLFGLLVLYFSTLLSAEFFGGGYEKVARFLGVQSVRSFIDLKVLLCGIEEYLQHQNPYAWTKCTYNYPLLWVIFSYIPYFSSGYFIQIGIFLLLLFFLSIFFFIGKINWKVALIYSSLLLSPSVMLAVERGNCDVIIFLLLLGSLVTFSKNHHSTSYALVLFGSFLKLFPVFGFIYLLEVIQSKKKLLWAVGLTVVIFVGYLMMIQNQLTAIYKIHPKDYFLSYGLFTLPVFLFNTFSFVDLKTLKIAACIVLVLVVIYLVVFETNQKQRLDKANVLFFNAYLMGSGIFVGTFILGNNYDYRLIFLIFTFPQLIHWLHQPHLRRATILQLILLFFVLWNPFITGLFGYIFHTKFIIYLIEELVCWVLFLFYLKFLVRFVLLTLRSKSTPFLKID